MKEAIICKICLEEISGEPATLLCCLESFCKECIHDYLQYKISNGEVSKESLTCPIPRLSAGGGGCGQPFELVHLQWLKVPRGLIEKYRAFVLDEGVAKDPNRVFCPVPDCNTIVHGDMTSKRVECRTCSHNFCFRCGGD